MGAGESQERAEAPALQLLQQQLRPPPAAAEHQGGKVVFLIIAQVAHRRVQIAAVGRQLLGRDRQQVLRRHAAGEGAAQKRVKKDAHAAGQTLAEVLPLGLKIAQLPGHRPGGQQAVQQLAQLLVPALFRPAQVAVVAEEHHGFRGDIVRRRGRLRVDQRHIPVRRREAQPLLQPVGVPLQRSDEGRVGRAAAALPGNHGPQVPGQSRRALGVQRGQRFRHGQEGDGLGIFRAALGLGVEEAHAVQLVAEELGADGLVVGRGIDVHDAAAHGELPHALHQLRPGIARLHQPLRQLRQGIAGPTAQGDGAGKERLLRHGAQGGGLKAHHQHRRAALGQVIQRPQTLLLPAPGDRRRVVERQLPARQHRRGLAQQLLQLLRRALHRQVVLAQGDHRPPGLPVQRRNPVTPAQLGQAGQGGVLPRPGRIAQRPVFWQRGKRR